jgi:hypothetical protein
MRATPEYYGDMEKIGDQGSYNHRGYQNQLQNLIKNTE